MSHHLCYIANGKLYEMAAASAENEIFSTFVGDLKRRLQSVEDRAAFRGGGSGASFMRGGLPEVPVESIAESFRAEFSCVAGDLKANTLCYGIDAGDVRGLFLYDLAENYERRVFHGPKYRFTSICPRSTGEDDGAVEWLVAAVQDHGASRIGLFKPDAGGGIQELTEGDSLDCYPVWRPGMRRSFVYQSAGIARSTHDNSWLGLGPASLESIDLESGEMSTVMSDSRYDFLCPAFGGDGSLYFLRRPYEPFHRPSIWRMFLDVLLFPFRLLRAIMAFLNVFSMFFSGKPLQTAGHSPKKQGPDPKAMFLHGRWVSMEKKMRDAAADELSMVPRNWELMRLKPDGTLLPVQSGVMAFAIGGEGTILYSNGRGIYARAEGDKPKKVSGRSLVTSIGLVPEAGERSV